MIAAAETETKGPPRRRRSPPRRVLILEDDYFVAAELARSVERLGCQVVGPVASAAEAVKLLSHDLQLVLCDVNLGDGIDVTVPEAAMRMDVPFALVTGYERAALPSHLQSAPHLCKPHGDLEIADLLDMTAPRGGAPEPENALWRRFSERTKARLRRHACTVHLRRRQTILHKGEPIRRVLFPESGACSILVGAPKPVETNLVGSEGAIGASAVFGATRAAASCKVQVDGRAVAVSVGAFRRILADDPEARDLVGEYILAQLNECGRLAHAVASATVARRVARWLLTCA
ncbi:MAG TPA: cyclic nucleotide-binding domain-containing protein, partial [Beijerinckiaceae bacterium]